MLFALLASHPVKPLVSHSIILLSTSLKRFLFKGALGVPFPDTFPENIMGANAGVCWRMLAINGRIRDFPSLSEDVNIVI